MKGIVQRYYNGYISVIANRKAQRTNSKKGDVLYGKLRPYLNKVIVADTDGVCTTEIIPLSGGGNLNNLYLFFWLKHPEFLAYVKEVGYGVNMPRLGTKDGIAAPFVLAPFAEQQQIAAKLDELLAQVDTLEKRLDTIPKILKRSVVEQTEIVTRVEQLFTYAGQIEQRIKDAQAKVNHLTQAILAKAFRDELTADWRAQNPDLISGENSAEALLAKIKAEREKIKSKNSK